MNKYEQIFMDIQSIFTDKGIFVEDEDVKVGFSYVEMDIDDEDWTVTAYPENDDLFEAYPIEVDSMSEFFEKNDVKFVVTQDKAEENKFMSWKEFCDEIDDADKTGRKYDLDIFSM